MRRMMLGLALVLGGAAWAQAAELIYPFHYGGWNGGAYRYDHSRAFSHCSVTARYEKGMTLGIGVTSDYRTRLVLENSAWSLAKGERYSAEVYVDNRYLSVYPAESFDNTVMMVDMGADATAFELLRWGRVLRVAAAERDLRFTMTDAYVALAKVRQCVELAHAVPGAGPSPVQAGDQGPAAGGGPAVARALPPAAPGAGAPGAGAPGAGAPGPVIERELVEFILAVAGIRGLRFLTPAEMRGMAGVAHAWTVGDAVGFVFQAPRGAGSPGTRMAGLLAALGEDCGGDFATASRAAEAVGRFALKQGFGSCLEPQGAATTYLTAVFGDLVVTVFGHTARGEAAEAARRSNDGVAEALLAILY